MYPASQMHPKAAQIPRSFGVRSIPLDQDIDALDDTGAQKIAPSYWRSLPIRTTLARQETAPSTAARASLSPEHILRRKTPGGVVDAGYDGSPIQAYPASPPQKHIILPVSSNTWAPIQHSSFANPTQHLGTQNLRLNHREHIPVQRNLSTSTWAENDALSPSVDALSVQDGFPIQAVAVQHSDVYQPILRAHEHNVRAFCPPPTSTNGPLTFSHLERHKDSFAQGRRQESKLPQLARHHLRVDQPPAISCARNDAYFQYFPACIETRASSLAVSQSVQELRWSTQPDQNIEVMHGALGNSLQGEPSFRERALLHSHQVYISLLSIFQAGGKTHPTKRDSTNFGTLKLPAYPKPPRLSCITKSIVPHTIASSTMSHGDFAGDLPPQARQLMLDNEVISHDPSTLHHTEVPSMGQYPSYRTSIPTEQDLVSCIGSSTAAAKPAALANAWNALDVLRNLCQQSEWEWIDGMLVGGCLFYALERYDDALKWFSRVVVVDPR